jgi:hypothetical protein
MKMKKVRENIKDNINLKKNAREEFLKPNMHNSFLLLCLFFYLHIA